MAFYRRNNFRPAARTVRWVDVNGPGAIHAAKVLILLCLSSISLAAERVERIAQAPIDEWYYGIGDERNTPLAPGTGVAASDAPPGARAKRNGGYVWAMAAVDDKLWYSTLNNGWCGWMMVTGQFFPTENSRWACETFRSAYPAIAEDDPSLAWPEGASVVQADWRLPGIHIYDTGTGRHRRVDSEHPVFKHMVARSFGFRAAGSADGVVFMASNPLVRGDAAVFILAFDGRSGEFIDGVQLDNYVNVRRFRVVQHRDGSSALYVLVGSEMHSSKHPNHLLRWTGNSQQPFGNKHGATPGFEVVGDLGTAGAGVELLDHRGHLLVTTWGSETVPAGLYRSGPIPDTGFSAANPARFTKVFDAADFDPDPVIAMSWLIGALEEFQGAIYWGAMFPNGQSFMELVMDSPTIVFKARESIVKAHRRTHLFRTHFAGPGSPRTELLYGEKQLWTYDDGQWLKKDNLLGSGPLFGSSGFGEYFNDYTWTLVKYRGSLYLGTFDVSGGMQLIARETDCQWTCLVLRTLSEHADLAAATPGFDLYRFDSADEGAVVVTLDGFGNGSNNGIRNAMVVGDALYLGSSTYSNLDPEQGGWELFRLTVEPRSTPIVKP